MEVMILDIYIYIFYLPNGYVQAAHYYSSSSPPKPFKPSEFDPSSWMSLWNVVTSWMSFICWMDSLSRTTRRISPSYLVDLMSTLTSLIRLYLQLNLHLRCIGSVQLFCTEQMEVVVTTTPHLRLLDLTSLTVHLFGTLELHLVSHRSRPTLFITRKFRYQLRMLPRRILCKEWEL